MQTTTRSDPIADYYIYDQSGVLICRMPEWEDVKRVLEKDPSKYARRVMFIDEPPIRASQCSSCGSKVCNIATN